MPPEADREPSDEQILSWWNQTRGGHAVAVTPEMVGAYTRQVVHAEIIARFDAYLAELLTASEWAYVAERLPASAPPLTPPRLPRPIPQRGGVDSDRPDRGD
jgi:hypothetical protein